MAVSLDILFTASVALGVVVKGEVRRLFSRQLELIAVDAFDALCADGDTATVGTDVGLHVPNIDVALTADSAIGSSATKLDSAVRAVCALARVDLPISEALLFNLLVRLLFGLFFSLVAKFYFSSHQQGDCRIDQGCSGLRHETCIRRSALVLI